MSRSPLVLRALVAPLALLPAVRLSLLQRGRPLVTCRLDGRSPLPSAESIRALADAPVAGLHLHVVDMPAAGWATLQALHEAMLAVRGAGRIVVVELETAGNAAVLLASAASHAVLRPCVHLHLLGVGTVLPFGGPALARLGLKVDVVAAGPYKSLGEAFTRPYASPENREAMRAVVAGLQALLEGGIAVGRGLTREAVRAAMDAGPLSPEDAVARGLVDALAYPDEVEAWIEARLARTPRRVALERWWARRAARARVAAMVAGMPRVAVVHLEGNVVDGAGAPGRPSIAAEPVVEKLDALREDDGCRAVVLHVRSGGGSATASDLLWRAVDRLAASKTVVAVFGDVAASGGYYLAAPAHAILARPGTLTGSIGVVGGKLVWGGAAEKLGVHLELLLGTEAAGFLRSERPFTTQERERFRAQLQHGYRAFLDRVARGRKRPVEAIEPLAGGRVWTGEDARACGLVDAFGGVEDGIARAVALAGLPGARRVDVRVGPRANVLQKLVRRLVAAWVPQAAGVPSLAEMPALAEALGLEGPWAVFARHPGVPLAVSPDAEALARA
jgi:protease-4